MIFLIYLANRGKVWYTIWVREVFHSDLSLYLSRIEDLPPKQAAGGSNPPRDVKKCQK